MSAAREPVPVEVELDPALHERLRHADPGFRSCRGQLMAGLSRLMAELGLPAEPDLSVGAGPGAGLPVEVTVAGSPCRSARRVASRAVYWAGAAGLPLHSAGDLARALATTADARAAVRALAAAVTEMIRSDAELLLTPRVVGRWATAAGLPAGWEPGVVLQQLVDLGLPPGTGAEVTEALEGHLVGSTAGLEAAIAARAGGAWEVRVHPDSLREITADALRRPDRFRHLRESFFADTGVRIPLVTLGEDASLPPGGLSFRVFGLTGPLVLDLHAAAEVAADRVTSASAHPGALIASALGKLAADRIGALVTTGTTAGELDRLSATHPKLRGLTSAIGLETVTRLLRALAAEYVNVRNFPLILQAALDVHERSGSVTDVELLHQVRIRLSHTITRAAAKGADHLEVSWVPKQLEDLSSSDTVARLMAFADQVVASGIRHGRVLVTSPQARAAVRMAVATAHPTLAVLGEDELAGAPQVSVTPD